MSAQVFVPADSAALSVGRGRRAPPLWRGRRARAASTSTFVRNGSRGLFWLEPLVEVETPQGRVGYGPIAPERRRLAVRRRFLDGAARIPRRSGGSRTSPISQNQQRLIFARCGMIDPLSLDDYRRHGGLAGLSARSAIGPKAIVEEVVASGLRGRGGAGFPTGIKWRTVAGRRGRAEICRLQRRRGRQRHVRRPHADGRRSFPADRRHGDRRRRGRRDEGLCLYPLGISARLRHFRRARSIAPAPAACSAAPCSARPHAFDIEARLGAGAYICGEETSLLESLEGRRGQVRAKPPLPAIRACSASRPSSTTC